MLMITRRATETAAEAVDSLVLSYDIRSRSRFRASLLSGTEVGVMLERGQVLRGGDRLQREDGLVVLVAAADESVTTVFTENAEALARIAYHLGNRHVALQIGAGWLRYSHDHVLDDMVMGLGARIRVSEAPFEPENGAYHGSHSSGHAHGHAHPHDERHSHGPDAGQHRP